MPKTYHARMTTPGDQPLALATLVFTPHPQEAFPHAGGLVAPTSVTVTTDAAGEFTVSLIPAEYSVRPVAANGMRLPTFMAMARDEPDLNDWLQLEAQE